MPSDGVASMILPLTSSDVTLEGLLRRTRKTCGSRTVYCDRRLSAGAPASNVYTSRLHFPLRDVRCCMNLLREDTESNYKARPIAIGAFGARECHPFVLNSAAAIQNQHAKSDPKG